MALDPVTNFAKVTVSTGYSAADVSVALSSAQGSRLPDPSADGAFNLVWYNATDYPDPSDDPNVEIVRCTARSGDTLTVTRAQEGTAASIKDLAGKTYKMLLAATEKTIADIVDRANHTGEQAISSVTGLQDELDAKQYKLFVTVGSENADYITDGTADEAQISAAILYVSTNGGGVVYLKDSTYHVSNSPVAIKDNVWLRGAGVNNTTIYGDATLGTNAVMLAGGTSSEAPSTDVTFSDFTIDGISMPTAPVSTFRKGIDAIWTLRWRLSNVRIANTPATGYGPDCNVDLRMEGCIADNCGRSASNPGYNGFGIGTGGYTNESVQLVNCVARNCGNNGFLLEYVGGGNVSKDYQLTNCYAYANKRGFRVSGAAGATFMSCKAIASTDEGFYVQLFGTGNPTPYNIKIIASDAYGNGGSGILFMEQEPGQINHIVEATHSYGNTGYGIVSGSSQMQIKNNVVYGNTKTGIFAHAYSATTVKDIQITGNLCYNNGTGGTPGYEDGIRVWGELGTVTGVQIALNRCFDNQETPTQQYGITLKGLTTEALVVDNDVRGNATAGVLDARSIPSDTSVTYSGNKGYNPQKLHAQGDVTGATTFDRANGDIITATLTGDITVTLPSGKTYGDELTLVLAQDATGSRSVSWPSNVKVAQGGLALSTTAGAADSATFRYDGTNWREVARALSDLSAGSVASGSALLDYTRKRPFIFSDFLAAGTSIVDPFTAVSVASGVITTANSSGVVTAQHPGVVRIVSSTTANSGGFIGSNTAQLLLGGGEVFEGVFRLETLALSTFYLGFIDSAASSESTDGAYVAIDSSGVVTGKTSSNSTRSSTGTTYSAAASTWYRLRITVNSTSLVTYQLYNDGGTLLWSDTLTANIPAASGRETGVGVIATSSGTTAVTLIHMDYMSLTWNADRAR